MIVDLSSQGRVRVLRTNPPNLNESINSDNNGNQDEEEVIEIEQVAPHNAEAEVSVEERIQAVRTLMENKSNIGCRKQSEERNPQSWA